MRGSSLRSLVPTLATGIVLLALLLYGLFEARRLIEGPRISVEAPHDGSAVAGPAIEISGTAQNVSFLSINGAQTYADQSGHFAETLAPPPGYTTVTVTGTDRFGRSATKNIRITILNYCPLNA